MSQFSHIIDIAKYGLNNDQENLLAALNELIEYSKKTKKINFALQLQSILKETIRTQQKTVLTKVGSDIHFQRIEDKEFNEFVIEKLTSDYSFDNLICESEVRAELEYFIKEHRATEMLNKFELPVANKVLLHGPSGCGKTLASYVIAGELEKMMVVINLGAIVSSRLGETSKNLSQHMHDNAFDSVWFGENYECILGVSPTDSMHEFLHTLVSFQQWTNRSSLLQFEVLSL